MTSTNKLTKILQIEHVTKQFTGTKAPAVGDVSLTLDQGLILGLLGPSGCGKTTLLRLIAGFEEPDRGSINLAGQQVTGPDTWVAPEHRSIGMVFQDFALFPHLSVFQNIAFGLRSKDRTMNRNRGSSIPDVVAEAIALVGLQGMENRYPHELSGGQQQRVALARALAPRPFLILLDEPLSNLDVEVRLYLRQEVRDILKTAGISAVFVTHDQEEALSISDRVAVMRQGHLEQMGSPEDIYCDPASQFVAQFVTQANFLPAQLKDQGWETEVGCFSRSDVCCQCDRQQTSSPHRSNFTSGVIDEALNGMIMVRQEDLLLEPDESGTVIIRDRQFLGREYCYQLRTESGQSLRARAHTSVCLPVGTRVKVAIANSRLVCFNEADLSTPNPEQSRVIDKL